MGDFEMRRLAPADAPEIAALIRAAFAAQGVVTDPPSSALRETADAVARKLAAGGGVGASLGNRWIGALLWAPEAGSLYLGRLAVAPEFRGRGLAGRLIAEGETEARAMGLSRVTAQARIGLARNRALFARLGFAEVDTRSHRGHAEPTIVVMEKLVVSKSPAGIGPSDAEARR